MTPHDLGQLALLLSPAMLIEKHCPSHPLHSQLEADQDYKSRT